MEFRILGPLTVVEGAGVVHVRAFRVRSLLAALLCQTNRAVTADALVEAVWGAVPPRTAAKNLQVNIHQLRRLLGEERIVRHPHGYRLAVGAGELDADVFDDMVDQALRAGAACEPARAAALLARALELWRGVPFADLADLAVVRELSSRLVERRWLAIEEKLDAELAMGLHAQVAAEAGVLVREHPLLERLRRIHMLALYRSGRQAEALRSYLDARRHLIDELGIEPSPTLQQLHRAILNGEPVPQPPVGTIVAPADRPASAPVSQLPIDVRGFVGRDPELARLTGALDRHLAGAVVCAITGAPGVGKTALAVHWAQRVADAFADGQVYVDLRGFGPAASVVQPQDALDRILTAFGVASRAKPADPEARAALYRTVLAGRKVLIVLDNARDSAHVRPLLPGAPDCVVVVTSRNQLTGLVATSGAEHVALEVLSSGHARHLLAARLGRERVAAEPGAVDDIIAVSGGLPLALAVLAARAGARRRLSLSEVASELRDGPVLDALTTDEDHTDVRTVFSWSYRSLGADAARLFRLFGLAPDAALPVSAAASLAGLPAGRTRPLLAELAGAHLVTEESTGRYAVHDLLRRYAREQCAADDPDEQRKAAVVRLLDHYLCSAHAADLRIDPNRDQVALLPPAPDVTVSTPADYGEAIAWFDTELPALSAAVGFADGAGLHGHAWQLAWAMSHYLDRRGHRHAWVNTQRAGLDAARRAGDVHGQAVCHRLLGAALCRGGDLDEAGRHLGAALELYGTLGDTRRLATTHLNLTTVLEQQDRVRDALEHATAALHLLRADRSSAPQASEAEALNIIGWEHALLGDHRAALAHCREALDVLDAIGDRLRQAATWDSVGYAHHHLAEHAEALAAYQRALELYREFGDRYFYAVVLTHVADTHHATGDADAGDQALKEALTIMEEMMHPTADRIRERLRRST
ncbi:AfsR/SARP family transcriptional regulator [Plantactinospora soyae]|uniref:DNA-binding SARP family transcriptional activator n=1 Tax=Plantactinospora soyae TaxID=1544732 RepID=A0A927M8Z9_9ACTN|nr:BTAD domain-containing putative transcriptional regulator [Plantactinospora soyae]MBE1490024.1 DNA-binding SARP family transcriptional activator [Plantactinospora soyae]